MTLRDSRDEKCHGISCVRISLIEFAILFLIVVVTVSSIHILLIPGVPGVAIVFVVVVIHDGVPLGLAAVRQEWHPRSFRL